MRFDKVIAKITRI